MRDVYDASFFDNMDTWAERSARSIVPLVYDWLKPTSILDVGGGTGRWAAAFAECGVTDYLCVDGDYVDRAKLSIPAQRFHVGDLASPVDLGRRFDLAICLEVAEHLPESSADTLLSSIARHADVVLFSAAVPYQGGTNHLNEQWPQYWADRFRVLGYTCFDCLRLKIWNDPDAAWWYKQNIFIYFRLGEHCPSIPEEIAAARLTSAPLGLVHPDAYIPTAGRLQRLLALTEPAGLMWSIRSLYQSASRAMRRRLPQSLRY